MQTLEEEDLKQLKTQIVKLLNSTKRENIGSLIGQLNDKGFFTSPASTKFHGSHKGGLMAHSYMVYKYFKKEIQELKLQKQIPEESIIICSILHDICKVGLYEETEEEGKPYKYNTKQGKQGHAKLSIQEIKKHITLTKQEEQIIRYHMGYYATRELQKTTGYQEGEYSIAELNQNNNQEKLTKLFHWCDDKDSTYTQGEQEQ